MHIERIESGHGFIADMKADLADVKRQFGRSAISTVITQRGFHALVLYRIARILRQGGIPILPLLLTRITQILYAIDIHPGANLAGGISIVHGVGIVIGPRVNIAQGALLFHGVTIGLKGGGKDDGFPYIENDCVLATGAVILGNIVVGANSIIGANVVLTQSVPPHSIVKTPPPIISTRSPASTANTWNGGKAASPVS